MARWGSRVFGLQKFLFGWGDYVIHGNAGTNRDIPLRCAMRLQSLAASVDIIIRVYPQNLP